MNIFLDLNKSQKRRNSKKNVDDYPFIKNIIVSTDLMFSELSDNLYITTFYNQ